MAYYIRKGLVEENIDTLEMIYNVITTGEPRHFKVRSPKQMNSTRHHFRRMLKAAERLPHEVGGKYKDLRSVTEVSLDWDNMRVTVRPKKTAPPLTPVIPSEDDMIDVVREYTGEICQLVFAPSEDFDPEVLNRKVQQHGFRLATNVNTGEYVQIEKDEELGTIMMMAERAKRKRSSVLEQFGFSRPDS